MLKTLYIKNYALIKDIHLEFTEPFTTITGETGAGKSILLGALSLLLGSRADKDSLRDSTQKCIIEAEFNLSKFNLEKVFESYDLDYEPQSIIRREIKGHKSRAFINDSPVLLKTLQELKPFLVDIHSQHETLSIGNTKYQYNLLDKVAKQTDLIKDFRVKFNQLKELDAKFEALKNQKLEAAKRQDYNQFLFDELERTNLYKGQLEALEQDYQNLNNAEEIQQELSNCLSVIQNESFGIYDQMALVNQKLTSLSNTSSTFLQLKERLQSVMIEIEDVANELEHKIDKVEVNPERLSKVEIDLQNLNNLLNKHQVSTDEELLLVKNNIELQLLEYSNADHNINKIEEKIKTTLKILNGLTDVIFKNRKLAALQIETNLIKVISNLGMQNARIKIKLDKTDAFNEFGKDKVEWLLSANKGMPLRPLHKVASGGELSRIMLAIKQTLSTLDNLPCIIFDEIDTGVSGEIALNMSEIMHNMSKSMQVISITHLPQIAAKGRQHLKVLKKSNQTTTETQIKNLDYNERLEELSNMLGGSIKSESAIAHAKSLLN